MPRVGGTRLLPATKMIVVGVWQPDSEAPVLTALQLSTGPDTPAGQGEWTSDAVAAGTLGSPVLSADGKTVYVNGRDQRLWALNASDGRGEMVCGAELSSRRLRRRRDRAV